MLRIVIQSLICVAFISTVAATAQSAENLLKNSGFEEELEIAWEKRTPDDADRKLFRDESGGRSGAAVVLENVKPAYTRLRQGHDRSITVEPGSLVELSAWAKSEQTDDGKAMLQIYCMDEKNGILAQPTSVPASGRFDWTLQRVRTIAPDDTAYIMAYLQTRDGTGRVWFDDVALEVKRGPLPKVPAAKIALLSDLPEGHACVKELHVLFEGLVQVAPSDTTALEDMAGALVLYDGAVPATVVKAVAEYARGGGRVFMDIRNFARIHGAEAVAVDVGAVEKQPIEKQMAAGLRVVKATDETAGFQIGQIMPRSSWPDGKLMVLPAGFLRPALEVLAVAPGGEAGLVRLPAGRGMVVACDILSLREPYCRSIDAYYKYTPVSGAMGNPVRFGQYFPRKLTYAEFIEEMKRLAGEFPAIRILEEGPASEDYRLYSLNLGRPGAPLYFLYAAAHGSEWEPGYGLLTFARRLAEGQLKDVIDLEKVEIKILPFLNPWGYDRMRRQNAQGVDLNRQGDYQWEKYQGRDSNNDGQWLPGDYDFKGSAPFSEPEAQVYRKIAELPNLYCVLDFHGNISATSNKVAVLPATAKPDNELMALELQRIANERLRGRHLLRQNDEDTVSQYLLDRVYPGGNTPFLMNTSARDRFGLLIELTAGYGSSYGTVLQTDVTCELCRALFTAYPPPANWPQ